MDNATLTTINKDGMDFPKIAFIYDRHKTASASKQASLEIRITYNKSQKYISTGIKLYPNQWQNGTITNIPDAPQLTQILDKMVIEVRQILLEMADEGDIDIFSVPKRIQRKKQGKVTLYAFMRQRAEIRKYGKSKDSCERYERFLRLFKAWGGIRSFSDITEANIIKYDKYLSATGMKPYSKWNNYHRFLNSFIIDAIDAGYIKKNPYKWVNIDKDKTSHGLQRCLSPEEFHRIKRIEMPVKSLEKVRDLFVFQTYTCLSYADLRDFDVEKIITVKGMKVYTGKRDKTGKRFTIPLVKPALEILDKYDGKLPVISNADYNRSLKAVASAAGIDKPVSTHWARHTGATMLLNSGVPMQVVSKICGHSSTRITEQVYAKLLDETIVDAVRNVHNKRSSVNEG